MKRRKKIKSFEPFNCKYTKYGNSDGFLNGRDNGLLKFFMYEKEIMYDSILNNIEIALENDFDYADVIKFEKTVDVLIMKKIDFDYFLDNAMIFYSEYEKYEKCEKVRKIQQKLHYI